MIEFAIGRRRRNLGSLLIVFFGAILLTASAAGAATITVDTLDDPGAPGECALRDAIFAANTGLHANGCAGSIGANTIVFAPGLSGSITLTASLPDIESDLTIEGPTTGGIAISGNHAVEPISIDMLSELISTVAFRNLTFTAGESEFGGAINNNGILTVDDCTFSDNHGNGGSILSIGTLTVTNSTFAGNNALVGGALGATPGRAGRTMKVVNSTFYENTATQGGAIFVGAVTLEVINSTFLRNAARAGSSIFSSFTIPKLRGVILAGSPDANNCVGDVDDEDFNISDDDSCAFTASGSHNNSDPLLDPSGLGEHGGPTDTIALESGSPAINQIPEAQCLATDQRGFLRPAPGQTNCDIGAFEANAIPPAAIDCDGANASRPNLVSLPYVYAREQINGIVNPSGPFDVNITSITQDKPVRGNRFFCERSFGVSTSTAIVRADSQSVGGLIYTLGFMATDSGGEGSCSGTVTVCVQDQRHQGDCLDTGRTFDSTTCPR